PEHPLLRAGRLVNLPVEGPGTADEDVSLSSSDGCQLRQHRTADMLPGPAPLVALSGTAGRHRITARAARLDEAAFLRRAGRVLSEFLVAGDVKRGAAVIDVMGSGAAGRPHEGQASQKAGRFCLNQRLPLREDVLGVQVEVEALQAARGFAPDDGDAGRT